MCVGVEYLTFDILLHAKSKQKFIGKQFCIPINFENPIKTIFFYQEIYFFNLCRVCLNGNIYLSFKKQAFNEFLKVIGIQR